MNNNPTVGKTAPARYLSPTVANDVPTSRTARQVVRRARSRALAARHSLTHQNELHAKLHLLEEDLDSAYRVQVSLLPQTMPQIEGLDVFASSRPARYVGGDFYDFIRGPEGAFTFTIGDVAGKGASAALLMSMLHRSVRTGVRLLQFQKPGDLLNYVNEDLYDSLAAAERFITTFVGCYDQSSHELTYADAGHGIALYCPHNQPIQQLWAEDMPLGIFSNTAYGNRTLKLDAADLLVISTDGLWEASNLSGKCFGSERVKKIVQTFAAGSAEEIGRALLNAVEGFHVNSRGEALPREDDQTLMVIKRKADPE